MKIAMDNISWQCSHSFPCDGPGCENTVTTQRTQWFRTNLPKPKRRRHYCCNACRQRAYRARRGCRSYGPEDRRPKA